MEEARQAGWVAPYERPPDRRRRPDLVVPGHQPRLAPTATGRHGQGTPSHQSRHETQPNLPPATAAIGSHLRPHSAHWRQPSPTRPSRVPPQAPPLTTTKPRQPSREPLQTRKAPPPRITDKRSYAEMASEHLMQIQREARAQRPGPKPLLHMPEQPQGNAQTRARSRSPRGRQPTEPSLGITKPTTDPGSALTATRHSHPSQGGHSAHHRRPSPEVLHRQLPWLHSRFPLTNIPRDAGQRSPARPQPRGPSHSRGRTPRLGEPRRGDRPSTSRPRQGQTADASSEGTTSHTAPTATSAASYATSTGTGATRHQRHSP